MKKLVIGAFVMVLALLPLQTKAENLFGFQDGTFYDSNQTLKYLCFIDKNCYDLNGNFAFVNGQSNDGQLVGEPATEPEVDTATQFKSECSDPIAALQQRKAEIEVEYLTKWKIITENNQGKFAGAVEQDVDALNRWASSLLEINRLETRQLHRSCVEKYPEFYQRA